MERPIVRHHQCPKATKYKPHPRMVEFFSDSEIFLDGQDIVVRIYYICPDCGTGISIDIRR